MEGGNRPGPGEIASLAALLDEHGEAVEADLAFRGIDLRDLWRGDLTWRRLGVLIDNLPPESATRTALRNAAPEPVEHVDPDDYGAWSQTDLLLAAVVDGINVLAWQQTQVHGGSRSSPPTPLPRPGVPRTTRRLTAAGRAYLESLRSQFREGGES